jgi:hypothetical protein
VLKEGWARFAALLWASRRDDAKEGTGMAENESILTNPPTKEDAVHVHDYLRFTKLLMFGAGACFVIGMLVLMIL